MQTAGLFFELPRLFRGGGKGAGLPRRLRGRGFQGVSVSMPHAACPGAQASPPAFKKVLSPKNTQDALRRVPGTQVANPEKSFRLRSVCNKRRAPPSFTLRFPSSPNPPRQTPRYSRTHSRTYPADLPTSLSPYAATPAHYPSPAARA